MSRINRKNIHWIILSIIVVGAIYTTISANKLWSWHSRIYLLIVVLFGGRVFLQRKDPYIRKMILSLVLFQVFLFYVLPRYVFPQGWGMAGYPWPYWISALSPNRTEGTLIFSVIFAFVFLPIATYLYGRRFYCGFICSRAALAETLGNPFRHLAPKGGTSRKLEVGMYLVLLVAIIVSILPWLGYEGTFKIYYNVISFPFLFVFGLALYPFAGGRTWCRYFCPAGAMMRFVSGKGRFALVGDKEKCVKCGKCNDVCEMGIDIESQISQGVKIKDGQCVGCGFCISSCPANTLRFAN